MSNKKFVIADVFTTQKFGGNQLAVFTEAAGLDAASMQTLAREMHFSESTFLFPPEKGGDYRVRIFTPEHELPFAGHPIVGTANVIVSEKMKPLSEPATTVNLETGVGLIVAEVRTEHGEAGHTAMTQPIPTLKAQFSDTARMGRALSLPASDIETNGLPIEVVFNGLAVIIVPVASLAAIQRIKVDSGALEQISNEAGAQTVLTFTTETVNASSTVHCRVFAPAAGILEDAATGSANGSLGAYLVRHRVAGVAGGATILSEQGFEMNRPSLLHIDIATDARSGEVNGVRVGGGVVISGRGEIMLP